MWRIRALAPFEKADLSASVIFVSLRAAAWQIKYPRSSHDKRAPAAFPFDPVKKFPRSQLAFLLLTILRPSPPSPAYLQRSLLLSRPARHPFILPAPLATTLNPWPCQSPAGHTRRRTSTLRRRAASSKTARSRSRHKTMVSEGKAAEASSAGCGRSRRSSTATASRSVELSAFRRTTGITRMFGRPMLSVAPYTHTDAL